jgi:hypothetical protein
MARELHLAEEVRGALRAFLEARRDRICAELGEYPRPVTACDVHYNRLLEERTAVCLDLERLDALRPEAFLASASCLDDEARGRFRALLAPVAEES